MRIGELGERELIKRIADVTGAPRGEGELGIGDDAALTYFAADKTVVTTKDLLVEGVHFLRRAVSASDLGYKALAVNLSDIAAMGAVPRHAYIGLALPAETEVEYVLDFYRGLCDLARKSGVRIFGGDLAGSPGPVFISVTLQGEAERGRALLRGAARAGDSICVTGCLGASAAGLLLLTRGAECSEEAGRQALEAHNRPKPCLEEGKFLAESGPVRAAMDISDGLAKDLGEICGQSGCGAILYEEKVPVHPAAAEIAAKLGLPPLDLALHGGEDYQLLFTVPAGALPGLQRGYRERFGYDFFIVGKITGGKNIWLLRRHGKREKLVFKGFRHF